MHGIIKATAISVAVTIAGTGVASADIEFEPAHHVTCFVQAGGPFKATGGAHPPIGFGYTVSCTDTPDRRNITYTLWRKNLATGEFTAQATGVSKDRDKDKTETFFSECSTDTEWAFHTQVEMMGGHGTIDYTSDDSDSVLLRC